MQSGMFSPCSIRLVYLSLALMVEDQRDVSNVFSCDGLDSVSCG